MKNEIAKQIADQSIAFVTDNNSKLVDLQPVAIAKHTAKKTIRNMYAEPKLASTKPSIEQLQEYQQKLIEVQKMSEYSNVELNMIVNNIIEKHYEKLIATHRQNITDYIVNNLNPNLNASAVFASIADYETIAAAKEAINEINSAYEKVQPYIK